jgi:hypothetical protein
MNKSILKLTVSRTSILMSMAIGGVALVAQPPTAGASPTRDVGGDPIVSISLKSEFPSFNMENALNHEMPIFDLTKVSVPASSKIFIHNDNDFSNKKFEESKIVTKFGSSNSSSLNA